MNILGLGYTDHEAAAALAVDGVLRTAIARERLTRLKRDGMIFGNCRADLTLAFRYCLNANALDVEDLDLVVWSHVGHCSVHQLAARLMLEGAEDLFQVPHTALPHHFAHACSAFYLSPFERAAVLVMDGNGGPIGALARNTAGPDRGGEATLQPIGVGEDLELDSFYKYDGGWTVLRKVSGRVGTGAAYGEVSARLFGDPLQAGKTMGLAPFGMRAPVNHFLEPVGPPDKLAYRFRREAEWSAFKEATREWRHGRRRDYLDDPLPASAAAGIQSEAEEAVLEYARWLRRESGCKNLCLAGGVALNCVANGRVARESGFDQVFVPPAPGDDGIAVGCALYGAALKGELKRSEWPLGLGRTYDHDPAEIEVVGLRRVAVSGDLAEWAAQSIAAGAVVGWYQGGAEFGPRALGHRSLLADPRSATMQGHLNKIVKNREPFRPFAPVVLEEFVPDWFDSSHPSYFMSFVASVRPEKRPLVPAITHVDGTSRYQVLRKRDNPELYDVIASFARLTGVPMLLNTSFNRAAEPIVETPVQAAQCVRAGHVDYLVLDGLVYA